MTERERWADQLKRDITWAQAAVMNGPTLMFLVIHGSDGVKHAYHLAQSDLELTKETAYALGRALAMAHDAVAISSISEAWMSKTDAPEDRSQEGLDAMRRVLGEAGVRPSRDPDRVEVLLCRVEYYDATGVARSITHCHPIHRDDKGRISRLEDDTMGDHPAVTVSFKPLMVPKRIGMTPQAIRRAKDLLVEGAHWIDPLKVKPAVML